MNALAALRTADWNWTAHVEAIWNEPEYDVPELHGDTRSELDFHIATLASSRRVESPLGVVVTGEAGAGKTHLLSALRKSAYAKSAGFVLIDLTDVHNFWETAQLGFLRALRRPGATGREQFRELLQYAYEHYYGSASGLMDVDTLARLRPPGLANHVDSLIRKLGEKHPAEISRHQDVVRALALVASNDFEIANIGDGWLQGLGIDEDQKLKYGFRTSQMAPLELLRALSWLFSLRAPLVVAFDQLDAIVAEHNLATSVAYEDAGLLARQEVSRSIIEGLAAGLMALRDVTRRTLSVVACLDATWNVLEHKALKSATDRFEPPMLLKKPESGEIARRLVARRLAEAYQKAGFEPRYSTWPFLDRAFSSMSLSPREILRRCHQHVRACVSRGEVFELESFTVSSTQPVRAETAPPVSPSPFDAKFGDLLASVTVPAIGDGADEALLDTLIEASCVALVREQEPSSKKEAIVDLDFDSRGSFEPLHARIRIVHHDQGDREQHYCFRFLEQTGGNAFKARINAAMTASGIDRALDFRRLRLLRSEPVPSSKVSKELADTFLRRGGVFVAPSADDLRTMAALHALLEAHRDDHAELDRWLRAKKPTQRISLLSEARAWLFGPAQTPPPPKTEPPPVPKTTALSLGRRIIGGEATDQEITVPIETLAKHTVVLAGAGSGKTVLVRRIVEEAARAGIPSIVLDLANDLARLGDPWPERPAAFDQTDDQKAAQYFREVETLIFTPGLSSGNPLSIEVLPDLSTLLGDPDEYAIALDLARTTLEPLAVGSTQAKKGRLGVLSAALDYHAKTKGGAGLQRFIDLLSDLPPEAEGGFQKAAQHARDMADALREQLRINPLLRGAGTALDPGVLLGTPAEPGKKTRISVINFIGLPSLESQQSFVHQLTVTLFSWIKTNPGTPERPLRGLLVIDEARDLIPSIKAVASRDSLIRLVAQARKYGLGLIFATQAPKSIDHNVIANCTTQCYGTASSPAAIDVIQEQIRQRGGNGDDVAKLGTGRFYAFSEGFTAPMKMMSRLSLSHHPKNPLDPKGIEERARKKQS